MSDNDNRGDKPQGPDNGGNGGGGGNPWMKSLLVWVGILLALAVFVTMFDGRTAATGGNTIAYSAFLDKVDEGTVKDVNISRDMISGTLSSGEVRIAIEGLPRELLRRLARRAIGSVRVDAQIAQPEWRDSTNIERLLDALIAGKRGTQAGVVVSPRGGAWRFRVAPARRN